MKSSITHRLLATALVVAIGTPSYASTASITPKQAKKMAQKFKATRSQFSKMSRAEAHEFFDIKNAKGESLHLGFEAAPVDPSKHWATLDPATSDAQGTATETVYAKYKDQIAANAGGDIIVAVIDSGVEITHPALKGHIWTNPNEVAGNNVDDDNNGLVDDINGWNYCGGPNGDLDQTTLEVTREVVRLEAIAKQRPLTAEEKKVYDRALKEYKQATGQKGQMLAQYEAIRDAINLLILHGLSATDNVTAESVNAIQVSDSAVDREAVESAKKLLLSVIQSNSRPFPPSAVEKAISELNKQIGTYYDKTFNAHAIIGDISDDPRIDNAPYGNNNMNAPGAFHATHVSGIIAGLRNIGLPISGQATNVKIMSLRAVPDGDERDKDVGNAIYYAVNNGAKVINMSFGKAYSPYKWFVDEAVRYAESKGVILVHAAGNSNKNTSDLSDLNNSNFPTAVYEDGTSSQTWIEVGASSANKGKQLPAYFSNYGKETVDVFAPGLSILSAVPGGRYDTASGTSMASPEVAGVAALLLNLFPRATAQEVRQAILTTTTQYDGLMVYRPGTYTTVPFASLSRYGGIVNAAAAAAQLESLIGSR